MTDHDTDQITPPGREILSDAWRGYELTPEGSAARKKVDDVSAQAKIDYQNTLDRVQTAYMDVRAAYEVGGLDTPTYEDVMAAVNLYAQQRHEASELLNQTLEDVRREYHEGRRRASWLQYDRVRKEQKSQEG